MKRTVRGLTIAAGLLVAAGLLAVQPAAHAATGTLSPNQQLSANQYVLSDNGEYQLIMQGDGNLVEYFQGRALWGSGTQGHPGAYAIMQGDGNLVIYRPGGVAIWATGTYGHPGAYAIMQGDANLVVYGSGGALWTNNVVNDHLTAGQVLHANHSLQSSSRSYTLIMQGDGNLVEYGPGDLALWNSQTSGSGAWAALQGDGNMCVYSSGGTALWCSGTQGHSGVRAFMQNDDNFVIYSSGGTALWATHPANGADPYAAGCATSDTWISPWYGSEPALQVRLFWSPKCNMYWAQESGQGLIIKVTDQFGDIGNDFTGGPGGHTVMVDGSGWGQGCVDYGSAVGWVCTPKLTHT
jgi:hypothetical protein